MAVDISLRATSLELYQFMCQHIVGTEETVRTKRLMTTISDYINSNDIKGTIISGSVGEGLELKDSDLDIMSVCKAFIVHEDTQNVKLVPGKMNLVMEINDTKPCFTQLRSLHNFYEVSVTLPQLFEQRGNSWYLSSEKFKLDMLKNKAFEDLQIIHGPCLSNINGTIDIAGCIHNQHWIQAAGNWITRGYTSWPNRDVKSDIIDHGVLFVPIGFKGSNNEELEWRISFSVAEKLLIYSFSHTQLLCYALMKILLKDLINSNIDCKNLLCSYFIKTIIFWVSEEIPVTEWKPENLTQCFMRCFKRLLYYVEFSMCPHYFIPINNLFQNKIEGQPRQLLLRHLNTLFSFGWRCVLFSEQLKEISIHSNALSGSSEWKGTQLEHILTSFALRAISNTINQMPLEYKRCIRLLSANKSSVIKLTCMRIMSSLCSGISQIIISTSDINKLIYSQRRTQLAYLVKNIHHDAVSGWIMLATFFYKTKHYSNALFILSYAIMKCTPEKVYYQRRVSQLQLNMTPSTTLQRLGILRVLKLVTMNRIEFNSGSTLIPDELKLPLSYLKYNKLPPGIFAQFLCFMCHYHLNEIQQCYKAIREIQQTIEKNYLLADYDDKFIGYILLAVALMLFKEKDLANALIIKEQASIHIKQTFSDCFT